MFLVLEIAFLISSPVSLDHASLCGGFFYVFCGLLGGGPVWWRFKICFSYPRYVLVERSSNIGGVMLYAVMYLIAASSLYSSMAVYASTMWVSMEVGWSYVIFVLLGSVIVFGEEGCV